MSTETGHEVTETLPVMYNIGDRENVCDILQVVDRMEKKLNELHQVVFTMLQGMEEARNSGGMMGMMAKNMLPEIPDLSQFTSNGHQGD